MKIEELKNNIFNTDCIAGMSEIPDESIDMVLCDLPYNTIAAKWDKLIPSDKLWEHYRRITKKNAAIVLFGSEPFATNVRNCAMDLYKYDWIWVKNSAACFVHAKNMPLKNFEVIMVFSKGGMGHESLLGENRMNYFPQGIIKNPKIHVGRKAGFGNVMGTRPSHKDVVEQEYENYPKSVLYFDKDPDSFHPCLPSGTKVMFNDKWINIEDVEIGFKNDFGVVSDKTTHFAQKLVEVETENGLVTATWNHPFLIKRENSIYWINAEQIKNGDEILCVKKNVKSSQRKVMLDTEEMEIKDSAWNTASFGKNIMGKFLKVCKSITKILTRQTITLKISNLSLPLNTNGCTKVADLSMVFGISLVRYAENLSHAQMSFGISLEDGLAEERVKNALSKNLSKTVRCGLQTVGSVRIIQERKKVYNLTIDGVPAFETLCGITHNTQKPVALLEYLIRTYTNEGDLVLDNCSGSGSTCIAAIKSNRNYLGFETDEEYYTKSLARIKNYKSQLTLF